MGRPKKTDAEGPVKIRFKKMKGGRKSIYLDCYRDGKRSYEFLKLYLSPGRDATTRAMNDNAMASARTIQLERTLAIQNEGTGLKAVSSQKMLLDDLMKEYVDVMRNRGSIGSAKNFLGPRRALRLYKGDKVTLRDVTKEFCEGFINFLRTTYRTKDGKLLHDSTKASYLCYFSTVLNYAVRHDMIHENPLDKIASVDKFKANESQRAYLTIDELKKMIDTPAYREDVKNAYLFACYCGLRYSDIRKLKWGEVRCDGGQWRAEIVQEKTSEPLYLPLSDHAVKYMPERGKKTDEDLVFGTLPVLNTFQNVLRRWSKDAGIEKHLTFHTSRHTFATLMLTLDVDLYTTSKLLGHTKVSTTQIYAKIINPKRDEAVNRVNKIFGEIKKDNQTDET